MKRKIETHWELKIKKVTPKVEWVTIAVFHDGRIAHETLEANRKALSKYQIELHEVCVETVQVATYK